MPMPFRWSGGGRRHMLMLSKRYRRLSSRWRIVFKNLRICSKWMISVHRRKWTVWYLNEFLNRFLGGLRRRNLWLTSLCGRGYWWLFNRNLNCGSKRI